MRPAPRILLVLLGLGMLVLVPAPGASGQVILIDRRPESEQVSLFLGESFVLTFQEKTGPDSFERVRTRMPCAQHRVL